MNEEKKNNGRGIFYGVIGVATLVVAIIGATFAYFTATGTDNGTITGNMATITFSLNVQKVTHVDETKGGMIPMSNSMVEAATTGSNNQTCVDDNGNAVCQVYKITVTNTGSASLFVDGYVKLTGGSGEATDVSGADTTMRWAQVFCSGTETTEITGCTTAGATTTGAQTAATGGSAMPAWNSIGIADAAQPSGQGQEPDRHNTTNIKNTFSAVTGDGYIAGNKYDIININYIRTSQRAAEPSGTFPDRNDDVASALVYNQNLAPSGQTGAEKVMYIVVWLSENGHNQTAGATNAFQEGEQNPTGLSFFSGQVVFNSAQGSEVTATFNGYTAVESDHASNG